MAITFVGNIAVPTDGNANADTTGLITIDKDAGAFSLATTGDLLLVHLNQRVNDPTFTVNTSGGQTWTSITALNASASQHGQLWYARFNGTWSADPVFATNSTGGNALSAIGMVFRPTNSTNTWDIDVAQSAGSATPSTPFDVTITGQTAVASSTLTIATWFNTGVTASNWALQTGGWLNPNSEPQWKNTTGTDIGVSIAYKINTSAGATGNVTNRQSVATGLTTITGIITFKEVATAPTFTVSPTVSSQTSTTYTLSYTSSTGATFYTAAVPAGATAPSAAQIKAGSGGGIVNAANEAVTGADTTNLTITGTIFPKYKICSLLSNAGGDTSIVELDNEFLDPPAGKQFQVFDVPLSGTAVESLVSASPAIVDGDIWVVDTVTTPGGYSIVLTDDGDIDINVSGDSTRQVFTHDVYDNSLAAYYGSGQVYIGNIPPAIIGNPSEIAIYAFPTSVAITPVDLTLLGDDAEDDALTVTAIDALPTGLSIVSGSLQGTPTVGGIYHVTLQWTDIAGDAVTGDITIIVGNISVPNVVGSDDIAAQNTLLDAYLAVTIVPDYSSGAATGTVISQSPVGGTSVAPFTTVTITVSASDLLEFLRSKKKHDMALERRRRQIIQNQYRLRARNR